MNIGIITSGGGHEFQINKLKWFFKNKTYFYVICVHKNTHKISTNTNYYNAHYPDSRNIVNLIKNTILAVNILNKEKPTVLLSSGAGIAIPFFFIGKLFFNTKLIFIEPYDFIKKPSLTGKLLYNRVDLFLVQHKQQKKWFPKAHYIGSLL